VEVEVEVEDEDEDEDKDEGTKLCTFTIITDCKTIKLNINDSCKTVCKTEYQWKIKNIKVKYVFILSSPLFDYNRKILN
jgi:hypothetical protein